MLSSLLHVDYFKYGLPSVLRLVIAKDGVGWVGREWDGKLEAGSEGMLDDMGPED